MSEMKSHQSRITHYEKCTEGREPWAGRQDGGVGPD